MNKLAYIAAFLRYLWIHRSWSSAVWCIQHEGKKWH